MNINFKFDINEIVEHVIHRENKFFLLIITGRIAEECPGGIQKKYLGRIFSMNNNSIKMDQQIITFHEEELKPYNQSIDADKKQ